MGRLTDLGSFIGAGGSGGIRGLTFLDSVSSAVPLEIVGGYEMTATTSDLSATVLNVEVGDVLLLCISDDNNGPSYITGWTEIFGLAHAGDCTVFRKTAVASGNETVIIDGTTSSGHDVRRSAVVLHLRGIDVATFTNNYYSPTTDANFYFQALAASAGPRVVIAFGALDDDKISTQSDQTAHGYTSYGAAVSSSTGSSAHVWAKITDGSAETQKIFSMNGGNDAYAAVIMGFSQAS